MFAVRFGVVRLEFSRSTAKMLRGFLFLIQAELVLIIGRSPFLGNIEKVFRRIALHHQPLFFLAAGFGRSHCFIIYIDLGCGLFDVPIDLLDQLWIIEGSFIDQFPRPVEHLQLQSVAFRLCRQSLDSSHNQAELFLRQKSGRIEIRFPNEIKRHGTKRLFPPQTQSEQVIEIGPCLISIHRVLHEQGSKRPILQGNVPIRKCFCKRSIE